jgi:hypothetical protein
MRSRIAEELNGQWIASDVSSITDYIFSPLFVIEAYFFLIFRNSHLKIRLAFYIRLLQAREVGILLSVETCNILNIKNNLFF